MALDIDLKIPRIVSQQTQHNHVPASNEEEYFRRSIFAPYLDSLSTSLKCQFSECENTSVPVISAIFKLHPKHYDSSDFSSKNNFMEALEVVNQTYHIENIDADRSSWYDFWTITMPPISRNQIAELTF